MKQEAVPEATHLAANVKQEAVPEATHLAEKGRMLVRFAKRKAKRNKEGLCCN
ncbi:hypothetical protein [Paenibacillus sp. LPE1-1-1.1]|uniref:hypothetical protein n=1 Tax=Paenibacillus sp. LPE1-1-1.1 TaxID=3135230 RepID=UPI003420669C